jgi:hypothetical protein
MGQATRFGGRFITFALVLLGMVVMIGTLTQIRVIKSGRPPTRSARSSPWL